MHPNVGTTPNGQIAGAGGHPWNRDAAGPARVVQAVILRGANLRLRQSSCRFAAASASLYFHFQFFCRPLSEAAAGCSVSAVENLSRAESFNTLIPFTFVLPNSCTHSVIMETCSKARSSPLRETPSHFRHWNRARLESCRKLPKRMDGLHRLRKNSAVQCFVTRARL